MVKNFTCRAKGVGIVEVDDKIIGYVTMLKMVTKNTLGIRYKRRYGWCSSQYQK
jgi:hypothetical protein